MANEEIGELFVKNFVFSLIKSIPVQEVYEEPQKTNQEIKIEKIENKIPTTYPQIQIIKKETEMLPSLPSLKKIKEIYSPSIMRPMNITPQRPMPAPIQPPPSPLSQNLSIKRGFLPSVVSDIPVPPPHSMPLILGSAFAKANSILKDPSVQSVECPGPGKPLLANKSGIMQTSSVILSKEEISSILEEVSEKTKIPLIEGLFKAMLGNLIITAVISEFVGTRFIMQKRNPLRPAPVPSNI